MNNRTQKLNKHYTDTTTKQNIFYEHRNQTRIMQRHQKYEDTEIEGHRNKKKQYKHYAETP